MLQDCFRILANSDCHIGKRLVNFTGPIFGDIIRNNSVCVVVFAAHGTGGFQRIRNAEGVFRIFKRFLLGFAVFDLIDFQH